MRQHHGRLGIAVVGGGAGGVELLLAMQYRLRNELRAIGRNPDDLRFLLLTADTQILPTHNPRVRGHFMQVLAERHVEVHCQAKVVRVEPGLLQTENGRVFDADETVWVTQAAGPACCTTPDWRWTATGLCRSMNACKAPAIRASSRQAMCRPWWGVRWRKPACSRCARPCR